MSDINMKYALTKEFVETYTTEIFNKINDRIQERIISKLDDNPQDNQVLSAKAISTMVNELTMDLNDRINSIKPSNSVKNIYSNEETVVGVYLDNPLFRRVFTGTITDGLKLTESNNIDKIIHQFGTYGVNCNPLPYQLSANDYCILQKVDDNITMTADSSTSVGLDFNVVTEYTKKVSGDGEVNGLNVYSLGYTGMYGEELVIPKLFVGSDGNVYNLTRLDHGTFIYASNLKSVSIPETVTEIGNNSFQNCTNLQSVSIADGTTSIGKYSFQYCKNLTEVRLPNTIKSIESYTFQYCESLESIVIPDGVTFIASWAFQYCKNLKEITLPVSLNKIDSFAFQHCESLTTINYKGSAEQWASLKIGGMNNYVKTATVKFNYV